MRAQDWTAHGFTSRTARMVRASVPFRASAPNVGASVRLVTIARVVPNGPCKVSTVATRATRATWAPWIAADGARLNSHRRCHSRVYRRATRRAAPTTCASLSLSGGVAFFTARWHVRQPLLLVKLLLADRPNELLLAVSTF
jgi:hypothetical protein